MVMSPCGHNLVSPRHTPSYLKVLASDDPIPVMNASLVEIDSPRMASENKLNTQTPEDDDLKQASGQSKLPIAMRVHPIALRLIFETTLPPVDFLDPSLSFGPQSIWSQSIRTRKALSLVCRSWRSVALLFLYQDIVFRRVGQIPALVRTLRPNQEGIEELVKSITFACDVPEPWDDLVNINIQYLMERCPNVRSLTFWGPFVDWLQTSKAGTRVFGPHKTFSSHSHSVAHLTYFDILQGSTATLDILPGTLLSCFPNLTHLSLTSHSKPSESYFPNSPDPALLRLAFPHLTHLDLLPKNGPIAMALFYILGTWYLPALTHLRMDLSLQWHNCTDYDHHTAFLKKFGPQLKFVNFGGNFSVHATPYEGSGGDLNVPMPVKRFVKSCTSVGKVGHLVMALWDVEGVDSLSWILEDEFEGWLDLWVPSKDFVLEPISSDSESPASLSNLHSTSDTDSNSNSSSTVPEQKYIPTHLLSQTYNRPNIRLLDQALAHIANLPLLFPPDSIDANDRSVYVHRVNGLTFVQTRQMIVHVEEDWREERPVWEVDEEDEDGDDKDEVEKGKAEEQQCLDNALCESAMSDYVASLAALPFALKDAEVTDRPVTETETPTSQLLNYIHAYSHSDLNVDDLESIFPELNLRTLSALPFALDFPSPSLPIEKTSDILPNPICTQTTQETKLSKSDDIELDKETGSQSSRTVIVEEPIYGSERDKDEDDENLSGSEIEPCVVAPVSRLGFATPPLIASFQSKDDGEEGHQSDDDSESLSENEIKPAVAALVNRVHSAILPFADLFQSEDDAQGDADADDDDDRSLSGGEIEPCVAVLVALASRGALASPPRAASVQGGDDDEGRQQDDDDSASDSGSEIEPAVLAVLASVNRRKFATLPFAASSWNNSDDKAPFISSWAQTQELLESFQEALPFPLEPMTELDAGSFSLFSLPQWFRTPVEQDLMHSFREDLPFPGDQMDVLGLESTESSQESPTFPFEPTTEPMAAPLSLLELPSWLQLRIERDLSLTFREALPFFVQPEPDDPTTTNVTDSSPISLVPPAAVFPEPAPVPVIEEREETDSSSDSDSDSDSGLDPTYDPEKDPYVYSESYYSDSDPEWDSEDELFVYSKEESDPFTDENEEVPVVVNDVPIPTDRDEGPTATPVAGSSSTPVSPRSSAKRPSFFERRGDVPQLTEEEALAIFDTWKEA